MNEERLKELAFILCEDKNALPIYYELSEIFEQQCLYHELGAILEKIWHITQEPDLYKKIGDIFLHQVRNLRISMAAYNRYLQFKMPDFYESYANNLYKLGYSDFEYKYENEDYTRELVNLCDRYNAIVHIMICLSKNKNYKSVLEIKNCLYNIKNQIDKYSNSLSQDDIETINETKESDKHLSKILSKEEHHNDINLFAIELDKTNKKAYINIIDDMLTFGNYNQALDFYNENYIQQFSGQICYEPNTLAWIISDYYRDNYIFYNAIKMQKIALEYDLEKNNA